MSKLRVLENFAGYGSQSIALDNLNIENEVVGISEIEPDAIIAYAAIRGCNLNKAINISTDDMKKILMDKNVGYDFQKNKSKIPRMKKDKLIQLFNADQFSNNLGDISIIKPQDVPQHDLFTYSFPCQSISVAGNMEGIVKGQTRSGLLYECEKIIEHCRPKYLLMENVKNLVGKKFKPQFEEWLQYLESLGYKNYWKVLNAKDFGIAQNRERVFAVSILGDESYEFPNGFKLEKRLKDFLEDSVDDKYYLSEEIQKRFKQTKVDDGINNIIGTTAPEFRTIGQRDLVYSQEGTMGALVATDYKQPKQIVDYTNVIEKADRLGGCFDDENGKHQAGSVWNKEGLCPTLDTMQGGYRQPLITEKIKIEKVGHLECQGWHEIETRVHSTNGLAPTVETRNRAKYLEIDKKKYNKLDFEIRKLTPRECFRLMGLSEEQINKIQQTGLSDSAQYKLAGNSIVVNVLEGIFKNLFINNSNSLDNR